MREDVNPAAPLQTQMLAAKERKEQKGFISLGSVVGGQQNRKRLAGAETETIFRS